MDAVLVFNLEEQRFALPASDVVELVRAARLTALPRAPAIVEGVLNVRGVLVPVLDLRRRFGLAPAPLHPDDHLVLARAGSRNVALRVTRAESLEPVHPGELDAAPLDWPGVGLVAGVLKRADGTLVVHDLSAFLSQAESDSLDAALAEQGSPA